MLSTLQARIKTLIESHDWFTGVTVMTEESGDFVNELEKALASLDGVLVVVLTPEGKPIDPKPGKLKLRQHVLIHLIENFTTNPGTKRAKDGVTPLIQALHQQWSGLGSSNISQQSGNQFTFDGYQLQPDELVIYQVRFFCDLTIPALSLP